MLRWQQEKQEENNMLTATGTAGAPSLLLIVGWVVVFGVIMYFMTIRPQKKQEKEHQNLLNSLEVNDIVLTSSGFYGTVIDITEDTVIVEFGNNKNCRIPMQKKAVVQVEKPGAEEE